MASASASGLISELIEKLHRIHVRLYPNYLKDVEGTHVARTEHETTLTIHDLAASLKNRAGFTGNVQDLIDYYEQLMAEVKYQVCDGYAVDLGIVSIHPRVGGTWEHPNEANDRKKHPVTFKARIRPELSRMSEAITLVCDGVATNSAYIDEVEDVQSGTVNETLTPGGAIVITGHRIKIAGTKPELGLFIEESAGVRTEIPKPYIENNASKVIAILPAGLPPGTYKLEINTQYAGSSFLKDTRIIQTDAIFTVGPARAAIGEASGDAQGTGA